MVNWLETGRTMFCFILYSLNTVKVVVFLIDNFYFDLYFIDIISVDLSLK